MNFTKLTDQQLMLDAKASVKQETKLITVNLHYIKEIDRRRLYSDYKLPGLLELVMTELGYPKDQAIRRIQVMRGMREIPEIEAMLEDGSLNITHVGLALTLFNHEKKEGKAFDLEKKRNVLSQIAGKSTREAQKILFSHSSTPIKFKEVIKMIGADTYEVTFRTNEATVEKIDQLKGLLAHTDPNISLNELMQKLLDLGLKEYQRVKPVAAPRPNSQAQIKREFWHRDENKCTNCGSYFAVQGDHKRPKALGGQYSLKNMRLLCRSCNQRAAIKHFGVKKMEKHLQ